LNPGKRAKGEQPFDAPVAGSASRETPLWSAIRELGRRIAAVRKGPIGVWFSVALAILVLGGWVGSKLGARAAVYWYHFEQRKVGTLNATERAHVESALSELSAVQTLQVFYAAFSAKDEELKKKHLRIHIRELDGLRKKSNTQEITPVIDLNLGLAYVYAAIAAEQDNNQEQAIQYMKSAQALFQSLGWQDYSEDTLRVVARREVDWWNRKPRSTRNDTGR